MRRAAKRDLNEASLLETAAILGAHCVVAGPLDLWVSLTTGAKYYPCEIKRPERKGKKNEYTKAQLKFFAELKAFGRPWLIWRSTEDILKDIQAAKQCKQ